jgi:hypothetical protein
MKIFLSGFLFLLCFELQAQFLVSSNVVVEYCNPTDSCQNSNNSAFLFYDDSKNEFFLKIDFSHFRSDYDTANTWLNRERDTCFYYRFIFPKQDFPKLGIEERETFTVNGKMFYNNKWKDQAIELNIFAPQKNLMNNTSGPNSTSYENYKINFTLPFLPRDFKTYKTAKFNEQTVNINVTYGRINSLKPGMESLLDEDFYQSEH